MRTNIVIDDQLIAAAMKATGFTIRRTLDCLIATFCLNNQHALLHDDRDFDPFERELGLHVVHPAP